MAPKSAKQKKYLEMLAAGKIAGHPPKNPTAVGMKANMADIPSSPTASNAPDIKPPAAPKFPSMSSITGNTNPSPASSTKFSKLKNMFKA